ncbi:hypothetical protein IG605_010090 [Pectobacterium quasiaquaticum]|uniref:hypothetical protein n=1 Tax=Pectobacterium quasiaquaticum TaxID=2774015 RepID=UPI0018748C4B|nr:hypothetical protein [Pectobacterium quasiaquaticum]URG51098.1 hypothetical protein IG605_010090 [Pectobacterium quasiaquaticum]
MKKTLSLAALVTIISGCTPATYQSQRTYHSSDFVPVTEPASTDQTYGKNLTQNQINLLKTNPLVNALGCDEFRNTSAIGFDENKKVTVKRDVFDGKRLLTDSKLICLVEKNYNEDIKSEFEIVVKESGVFRGTPVAFYHSDGSTTIGGENGWSIGCKRDAMTDRLLCNMSRGDLFIVQDSKGYSVAVMGDIYPGSVSSVRINGGKPYNTSDNDAMFGAGVSTKIVKAIHDGTNVITRYYDWPYNAPRDREVDTKGYDTALGFMNLVYRSYIH